MTILTFTSILATLTLAGHFFFILLAVSYAPYVRHLNAWITGILKTRGQLLATIVAGIATVSPLIYTHIFYLAPCNLCWYQRIFMFPITVLLIIAQIRGKAVDKISIYVLAVLGFCTSVFHYAGQRLHSSSPHLFNDIGCDSIGMSASCSDYYFLEYGYITIPFMAMTAFVFIIVTTFFSNRV